MFKRRTSWICQFCDSKEKNLDVFCRYCFRNRPLSLPSLLPSAATSSTEDYDGKGGFYSTEQIKQNETFLQHAMNEVKFEKCNEMDKSFLINKFNTKQNGRKTIQSASKDGSQPVYRIMRPCGLCMVGFPTAQLTKTVSNRLVQQWKETHNTSSSSSSSSSAFPSSSSSYISSRKGFKSNSNQYDIVHICVFCFQFFDDSSSTNKFKDIDALQRELLPHNYSKENMLEYEARKIESTFKRPISRMKLKISKSALQNKRISAILSAEKQSFLLRSTCNNTVLLNI